MTNRTFSITVPPADALILDVLADLWKMEPEQVAQFIYLRGLSDLEDGGFPMGRMAEERLREISRSLHRQAVQEGGASPYAVDTVEQLNEVFPDETLDPERFLEYS